MSIDCLGWASFQRNKKQQECNKKQQNMCSSEWPTHFFNFFHSEMKLRMILSYIYIHRSSIIDIANHKPIEYFCNIENDGNTLVYFEIRVKCNKDVEI